MKAILSQLARSGVLVDDAVVTGILNGTIPPLEAIVDELLIVALDAEITVRNDSTSTWNHRRLARLGLALALLGAIACLKEQETGQ
jgi:hypothetical protein